MIQQVQDFHRRFELPDGTKNILMEDQAAADFRLKFLREEVAELQEALERSDEVAAFDALLDLAYVTYGTALFLGVDPRQWVAGMTAVHMANMAKVRAKRISDSKRGSTFDVVKPAGWVGPENSLRRILSWPK